MPSHAMLTSQSNTLVGNHTPSLAKEVNFVLAVGHMAGHGHIDIYSSFGKGNSNFIQLYQQYLLMGLLDPHRQRPTQELPDNVLSKTLMMLDKWATPATPVEPGAPTADNHFVLAVLDPATMATIVYRSAGLNGNGPRFSLMAATLAGVQQLNNLNGDRLVFNRKCIKCANNVLFEVATHCCRCGEQV